MASATGILEAYRLPQPELTLAVRDTAAGERSSLLEFHKLLDWSQRDRTRPRSSTGACAPDARPRTLPESTL